MDTPSNNADPLKEYDFFKCENVLFMKTLLLQIPTAFFVCDEHCRILFINEVYANYLNKTVDEIIGKYTQEIFTDSVIPHILTTGKPMFGGVRKIKRNDEIIQLIVNRIPLFDDNGKIMGAMVIALADTPEQIATLTKQMKKLSPLENYTQHSPYKARYTLDSIIGKSMLITRLKEILVKYAQIEAPILILGETGTGKELAASSLHNSGPRANGPFIALNCSAFPLELFESELFGYAPGSFSGANKEGKIGQIELADQGTLFLDEIGDLPLLMQVKLLRVLEEKKITPIGSVAAKPVDFKLIAATNKDLRQMVKDGTFREDFYYRINALVLNIPSLTERKEDIPLIVKHILKTTGHEHYQISPQVMESFMNYSWQGNIRELNNVLMHALSLCQHNCIEICDLPENFHTPATAAFCAGQNKFKARQIKNDEYILLQALEKNNWNVKKTAQELDISRANMYEKMKKLGIKRP